MRPETRQSLTDIRDAGSLIVTRMADASEASLAGDPWLAGAVHYQFTIIGEALNNIRKTEREVAERLSEWQRVIGYRNQIVHGYATIRPSITWTVIRTKLPVLLREVEALLNDPDCDR